MRRGSSLRRPQRVVSSASDVCLKSLLAVSNHQLKSDSRTQHAQDVAIRPFKAALFPAQLFLRNACRQLRGETGIVRVRGSSLVGAAPRKDLRACLEWSVYRLCRENWVAAYRLQVQTVNTASTPATECDAANHAPLWRLRSAKPRWLRRPLSVHQTFWLLRHQPGSFLSPFVPVLWDLIAVQYAIPLLSVADLAKLARLWPVADAAESTVASACKVRRLTELTDAILLNVHQFSSSLFCQVLRDLLRVGVCLPLSSVQAVIASRTVDSNKLEKQRAVTRAVVVLDVEEQRDSLSDQSEIAPEALPAATGSKDSNQQKTQIPSTLENQESLKRLLDFETEDVGFLLGQLGHTPEFGGELLLHCLLGRLQQGSYPSKICSLFWTLTGLLHLRHCARMAAQCSASFRLFSTPIYYQAGHIHYLEQRIQEAVTTLEAVILQQLTATGAFLIPPQCVARCPLTHYFSQQELAFHVVNLLYLLNAPMLSNKKAVLLSTAAEQLLFDKTVSIETVACTFQGLLLSSAGRSILKDGKPALIQCVEQHISDHLPSSPAAAAALALWRVSDIHPIPSSLRQLFVNACASYPTQEHYRAAILLGSPLVDYQNTLAKFDCEHGDPKTDRILMTYNAVWHKRRLAQLPRNALPFSDHGFSAAMLNALRHQLGQKQPLENPHQ